MLILKGAVAWIVFLGFLGYGVHQVVEGTVEAAEGQRRRTRILREDFAVPNPDIDVQREWDEGTLNVAHGTAGAVMAGQSIASPGAAPGVGLSGGMTVGGWAVQTVENAIGDDDDDDFDDEDVVETPDDPALEPAAAGDDPDPSSGDDGFGNSSGPDTPDESTTGSGEPHLGEPVVTDPAAAVGRYEISEPSVERALEPEVDSFESAAGRIIVDPDASVRGRFEFVYYDSVGSPPSGDNPGTLVSVRVTADSTLVSDVGLVATDDGLMFGGVVTQTIAYTEPHLEQPVTVTVTWNVVGRIDPTSDLLELALLDGTGSGATVEFQR